MADERPVLSIQDALEQNAEYFGFDLCDKIRISDSEVLTITYRELLDKPTGQRVDQVYAEYGECDRVTIEYTTTEGKTETIQGEFKEPRQKGGQLFNLDEKISIALWGQDAYDRYIAAGGPPGLVLMTWERMRRQIRLRAQKDPK